MKMFFLGFVSCFIIIFILCEVKSCVGDKDIQKISIEEKQGKDNSDPQ